MAFLKKCITVYIAKRKKVKLINHDCLPIFVLLYIMLCIIPACLMLFAALSNAVCLYSLFFLQLIFANAFCLGLLAHSLFISSIIFNMHGAFNMFVFPNSMFITFFI